MHKTRRLLTSSGYLLSHSHHWRHAITGTVGCCVSLSIGYVLSIRGFGLFYCALSAALTGFFEYGNALRQQLLMLVFGAGIMIAGAVITHSLIHHTAISFIALIVICGVLYFYTLVNTGFLFICKLSIIVMAFSYVQQSVSTHLSNQDVFFYLLLGCSMTIIAHLMYYMLFTYHQITIRYKNRQLIIHKAIKFFSDTTVSKLDSMRDNRMDETLFTPRWNNQDDTYQAISIVLHKYDRLIELESVSDQFRLQCQQFFNQINQDGVDLKVSQIQSAHQRFQQQTMTTNRPQNLDEIELCYLIHRLSNDLVDFYQPAKSLIIDENQGSLRALLLDFKNALLATRLFDHKRLTDNSKVAIRAMIAIGCAFGLALVIDSTHPDWIILTTNLVLQVRSGDTSKKVVERMLGHCLGFLIAFICILFLWPQLSNPYIWIPLLIFLCTYSLNKNYFLFSSCIMITILYHDFMIFSDNAMSTAKLVSIATDRLADTFIGVSIALTASLCIFNRVGHNTIESTYCHLLEQCRELLTAISQSLNEAQLSVMKKNITQQITDNKALYHSLRFHPLHYFKHKPLIEQVLQQEFNIESCLNSVLFRLQSPFATHALVVIQNTNSINHVKQLDSWLVQYQNQIINQRQALPLWPEQLTADFERLQRSIQADSKNLLSDCHQHTSHYETNLALIGFNQTLLNLMQALKS